MWSNSSIPDSVVIHIRIEIEEGLSVVEIYDRTYIRITF